jgi:hypothetical protein
MKQLRTGKSLWPVGLLVAQQPYAGGKRPASCFILFSAFDEGLMQKMPFFPMECRNTTKRFGRLREGLPQGRCIARRGFRMKPTGGAIPPQELLASGTLPGWRQCAIIHYLEVVHV